MIDTAAPYPAALQANAAHYHKAPPKILRWQDHDRMAGSIPVWDTAKTAQDTVTLALDSAAAPATPHHPAAALSYTDSAIPTRSDAFGFGDLVDMVNPLHHIPIVGHIYREITGDEIKPISRIIGGGLFGGGIGAASGLVDTIIEYETGHDTATNALNLVKNGTLPAAGARSAPAQSLPPPTTDTIGTTGTISALSSPAESPLSTLGTAIAFADLGHPAAAPKPAHNTPPPIRHNGGYRFRVND